MLRVIENTAVDGYNAGNLILLPEIPNVSLFRVDRYLGKFF